MWRTSLKFPDRAGTSDGGAIASVRYSGLQWLRGFAALLVFCEHMKNEVVFRLLGHDLAQYSVSIFPFSAGVDVFFVISGFVIAHASVSLYGRPGAWKTFLKRRLARVVPLYWLITSLFILFLALGPNQIIQYYSPFLIVGSYLFLPLPRADGSQLPVMPLGWTLNYEMLFYVVFAATLALPRRVASVVLVALLILLVAIGRAAFPLPPVLAFWCDPIVLEFLAGFAIQAAVAKGLRLPGLLRAIMVVVAIAVLFLSPQELTVVSNRWLYWGGPAVLLVLAATTGSRKEGRHDRIADWMGNISYALYLSHLLVLLVLTRIWVLLGLNGSAIGVAAYIPVSLVGALAAASVLFVGFERPVLRALRRRIDHNLTRGPGAPPGP